MKIKENLLNCVAVLCLASCGGSVPKVSDAKVSACVAVVNADSASRADVECINPGKGWDSCPARAAILSERAAKEDACHGH